MFMITVARVISDIRFLFPPHRRICRSGKTNVFYRGVPPEKERPNRGLPARRKNTAPCAARRRARGARTRRAGTGAKRVRGSPGTLRSRGLRAASTRPRHAPIPTVDEADRSRFRAGLADLRHADGAATEWVRRARSAHARGVRSPDGADIRLANPYRPTRPGLRQALDAYVEFREAGG